MAYGLISTYYQIIFLHQVQVNGQWVLEYSPIIKSKTAETRATPGDWRGSVSTRQAAGSLSKYRIARVLVHS